MILVRLPGFDHPRVSSFRFPGVEAVVKDHRNPGFRVMSNWDYQDSELFLTLR